MNAAARHLGAVAAPLRDRKPRHFAFGGETLLVRVRESARARTARIIVGPRRPLEVIVPRGVGDAEVDRYLEEKRSWIENKVVNAREIAARLPRLGLQRPGFVWLAGDQVPVEIATTTAPPALARLVARLRDGHLVVADVAQGDGGGSAARAIERWYRREARRVIGRVAAREAERLGLQFGALAIRDQRTRWGSCSPQGNLSFSWRLLVAPHDVLAYLVVHELCHLREPSHQKPFWRMLDAARPGWQEQARWLREHGQELHHYDIAATVTAGAPAA
jgi:predicted metal-dependent hydrolase